MLPSSRLRNAAPIRAVMLVTGTCKTCSISLVTACGPDGFNFVNRNLRPRPNVTAFSEDRDSGGVTMNLAERIAPHLPYLRRLARATTGNQVIGDAFVADLLQGLIVEPGRFRPDAPAKTEAFRLLCESLGREGVASNPKRGAA